MGGRGGLIGKRTLKRSIPPNLGFPSQHGKIRYSHHSASDLCTYVDFSFLKLTILFFLLFLCFRILFCVCQLLTLAEAPQVKLSRYSDLKNIDFSLIFVLFPPPQTPPLPPPQGVCTRGGRGGEGGGQKRGKNGVFFRRGPVRNCLVYSDFSQYPPLFLGGFASPPPPLCRVTPFLGTPPKLGISDPF